MTIIIFCHNSLEDIKPQPLLRLFICTSLSFSATPVVSLSPASTLSCIKTKNDRYLTHAEVIAAEKLVLIKLDGSRARMG